jgi:hypothetical protein
LPRYQRSLGNYARLLLDSGSQRRDQPTPCGTAMPAHNWTPPAISG